MFISETSPVFTQGSFETTASALDLAIDGNGFFIVSEDGARHYSRAGQFSLNKDGNIVNPDGLVLQGYLADASGNITGTIGNLQITSRQSPANITSSSDIAVNLKASAAAPSAAFTLDGNGDTVDNDPANYNSSTTISVYDSQGGAHQVTLYFIKTGNNAWDVHYVHQDPADSSLLVDAGTQSLTFNTGGALIDDNSGTAISFDFGASVTTPQTIEFNYGTGTGETPVGDGFDGTTQFASDFTVMNISQDGYSSGSLKNMAISEEGIITGAFTNGQTRGIGQIASARFVAPASLTKLGR
ncbi:MAG: flagellar hook protein FlgE, partial [bacterium]